ncbi:hypothetical protein ACK3SF_02320 [Candidatus Nanosalina sp. VS9-1]|uniref:hypothetical protein n=1 Tax=Candidatus Nanosalina sp. VS9-1 TaxID=3388566 RepID=UPI0039E11A8D
MNIASFINPEIVERVLVFIKTPVQNTEILPNVLPLILGLIVMELYFGKHKKESLGWNTAEGNAIIWLSTGLSLYFTPALGQMETYAVYALIGIGFFVAYMDFFHKWPSTVAFVISSSALVYTLAYTLVIVIKAPLPMNMVTYQAAGIFFVGVNILFKFIQGLETDSDPFGTDF